MNIKLSILLVLSITFANILTSFAQISIKSDINTNSKIGMPGEMEPYYFQSFSASKKPIIDDLSQLVSIIKKQHPQNAIKSNNHPKFITPVRQKDGSDDPGFYSITAYYDHNPLYPDYITDFNCGNLTYDLPTGYNHAGTDYFLWPFPWQKMEGENVEVIAAAAGTIEYKQDGFFDQSCGENSDPWNGLGILHEDGSTSWYVHLKKNSLTEKPLKAYVDQGEYLGIVGSSGQSFAPHLHFEVYNASGQLIDPFAGPCNNTVTDSWWQTQEPYKQSALNRLATNVHLPEFPACPNEEIPNESNSFYPNDTIFLLSYYRNVFFGDTIIISIFRPGGLLYSTRVWLSPENSLTTSWLWFPLVLNKNEPGGEWTYKIMYKGLTYEHKFQFINAQGIEPNGLRQEVTLFPNPVKNYLTININDVNHQLLLLNVFNVFGKANMQEKLIMKSEGIYNLDVSILEKGVYFLELNTSSGIHIVKFIKL